ncbi:MAG: hypothetical protein JWO67_3244 [Streptosporangiaceae bacterium]|jgi:hypothetical protein|nr:hypothetical protein [Streptosporangiaceae bacterium]
MATSMRRVVSGLTGTPWSVRLAGHGRAALEIYDEERLIDVVVATPVAPELLRGARRGVRAGHPYTLAWGRLPGDPADLAVTFTRGRLRRRAHHAEVTAVGEFVWLAVAAGRFDGVTVTRGEATCARRRVGTGRSW